MREITAGQDGHIQAPEVLDITPRQALNTLAFAARFTGVVWMLRGLSWCILVTSPLSALAWYGVDPHEYDKYHLAILGYLRLIMVAMEIYYGGFLIIATMFSDLFSTRNCVHYNAGALLLHALLVMAKKQECFDNGGFSFDGRVMLMDVFIFDVIPLIVCVVCLVITAPAQGGFPGAGGSPDKKIISKCGVFYCLVCICVGVFKAEFVVQRLTTPMFLIEGVGYDKLLSGWVGLVAGSFLITMHTFVMLGSNTGQSNDYHCSRCSWTWCCVNVTCWLVFKVFLESNSMKVGLVNVVFLASAVLLVVVFHASGQIESSAAKAPELFYRRTWLAA